MDILYVNDEQNTVTELVFRQLIITYITFSVKTLYSGIDIFLKPVIV